MNTYFIGSDSGSDAVAIAAIVISLLTLSWSIWNELNSYRRRQADEHWYREIFSPHCVEPVIDLLNKLLKTMRENLKEGSSIAQYRECSDNFGAQKEEVLRRVWVAALFSDDFYDYAKTQLDGVEDDLVKAFGAWSMRDGLRSQNDADALERGIIARVTKILGEASTIDLRRFGKSSAGNTFRKRLLSRIQRDRSRVPDAE